MKCLFLPTRHTCTWFFSDLGKRCSDIKKKLQPVDLKSCYSFWQNHIWGELEATEIISAGLSFCLQQLAAVQAHFTAFARILFFSHTAYFSPWEKAKSAKNISESNYIVSRPHDRSIFVSKVPEMETLRGRSQQQY